MHRTPAPRTLAATIAAASAVLLLLPTAPAAAAPSPSPSSSPGPSAGDGYRFALPEPTGRFPVGGTELHLVDHDRADPLRPDREREIMVTVFYPAASGSGARLPYIRPGAAELLDADFAPSAGLEPGAVDWAGVPTAAREDAPAATGSGRRPVVLYSPGGGVIRGAGTGIAQDLASRGYVVVAMDHTGEAPVEFPDGRVEGVAWNDETPDLYLTLQDARLRDTRFVLDTLGGLAKGAAAGESGTRVPRGLARILDLRSVGAFGHSMGGGNAVHTMREDDRVDAAVDMDGSLTLGEGDAEKEAFEERFPVVNTGVRKPVMLMGGSDITGEGVPNTHRTFADWASFWRHSTGWKRDLNTPEARHFSFTDHQVVLPQLDAELGLADGVVEGTIGTADDPARVFRTHRDYVAAFFDHHLRGADRPILDGDSPAHPDVEFVD